MKLAVTERIAGKKSEINSIRREGNIPAVLYSKGKKGKELIVLGSEFKMGLSSLEEGTLSAQIFSLSLDGAVKKAILKDIQYEVVTYDILHLDFVELHDDVPVTMNIPMKVENGLNCIGVKQGGFLQQVMRSVKIRALPKAIPPSFKVDVTQLGLGQSLYLRDITVPKGVHLITDPKGIVVVVSRR